MCAVPLQTFDSLVLWLVMVGWWVGAVSIMDSSQLHSGVVIQAHSTGIPNMASEQLGVATSSPNR